MCRSSGAERSRKLRSLRGCVRMTADTLAAMPGRCRAPVCKSPRNFALCCKMLGKRHPTCSWAILSGGYNVRVFNGNYPGEVTRIVLVDSTQEDQYELLPPAWGKIYSSELRREKRQAMWAPIFVDLGLARWMHGAGLGGNAYLILQSKYLPVTLNRSRRARSRPGPREIFRISR